MATFTSQARARLALLAGMLACLSLGSAAHGQVRISFPHTRPLGFANSAARWDRTPPVAFPTPTMQRRVRIDPDRGFEGPMIDPARPPIDGRGRPIRVRDPHSPQVEHTFPDHVIRRNEGIPSFDDRWSDRRHDRRWHDDGWSGGVGTSIGFVLRWSDGNSRVVLSSGGPWYGSSWHGSPWHGSWHSGWTNGCDPWPRRSCTPCWPEPTWDCGWGNGWGVGYGSSWGWNGHSRSWDTGYPITTASIEWANAVAAADPVLRAPAVRPSTEAVAEPVVASLRTPMELRAATEALRLGGTGRALDLLRARIDAFPDDAHAQRLLGVALIMAGDESAGVAVLGLAYQRSPSLWQDPIPADETFESRRTLRAMIERTSRYANRANTASSWQAVASLIQSDGRPIDARRQIAKAERAGLAPEPLRAMRGALLPNSH